MGEEEAHREIGAYAAASGVDVLVAVGPLSTLMPSTFGGESHTAEWHESRGLVDHLFEPGEAYIATRTFIDTLRPKLNGIRAMVRARQRVLQLSRAELMEITEDWVESAFTIEEQ